MARKRVPAVLWQLFGERARSLDDTILGLIRLPPETVGRCPCNGRRCLSCVGPSFLVRSDDSPDYKKLLNECFVVVSENAPPLTVFDPNRRRSQLEIVRRSIELILCEQPSTSNLICCGYDKARRASPVVDELSSSNWKVLLKRVGDELMMYLLRYTSLFLPLSRMQHHQVSGFPIDNLCYKFSRQIPQSKPLRHNGSRKRKLVEEVESIPRKKMCTSEHIVNSRRGSSYVSMEDISHTEREGSSKENGVASHKRTRQFRWQRQRKRRQLVIQGAPSLIPCGGNHLNNDNSCKLSHCFCCSVFQKQSKMKKNTEIDRRNIFYKLEKSVFPMKHILHTLKANAFGAAELFNNIFETFAIDEKAGAVACSHTENGLISFTCLYHCLTKLLRSLIRSSQNCRFQRLLEKHCPISTSYQDSSAGPGTGLEGSKCCPKKDVVSFLWAICRRIVPSPLLGEPSSWRILRRNISKFIHLGRFEKFSLKECTYKLKITKFSLFSGNLGVTDTVRHAIFESWILWFFSHVVSPLVQANFYITETDHEKQEVLYYRKPVWLKLMKEAECFSDNKYNLLNHESAIEIMRNRSFGFSRARFRPKLNGLRMLTNLGASSRMPVKASFSGIHFKQKFGRKVLRDRQVQSYTVFKPANDVLYDSHLILKGLSAKEPEILGSSVFGYNDVYRKLVPFHFLLKNGSPNVPSVFMVVSDVSKAFDSINQDKMICVMNDVMMDDEFTLEKLIQVLYKKESLKVHYYQTLAHQDIATAFASITSRFHARSSDSVVVKKQWSRTIGKEEILSKLKEHILRNVVRIGNNFYMQNVGIPQGSVLSTLLCSIYYGHMERNVVLPILEKAGLEDPPVTSFCRGSHQKDMVARGSEYLMLRLVDDFLFISTSEKQASMFFSQMERGVPDYNCRMNREKFGVNFIMSNGQQCHSNRLHVGKDGISFLPWSGLLLNSSTLEIQADYTRYLNCHLSSNLTVISRGKVGSHLKTKLRSFLRPKCHPLFYDSNINSPAVVRLNIYQAFLLAAMKFVSYISNLSALPKFTPSFCFKAINSSLRYMSRLIKRKMYSFEIDPALRPKYDVKNKEVIWLGLYAYSRVIRKKQSRYKVLLRYFNSKLEGYGRVEDMSNELKYAIDDVHSSVLWSIKY